MSAWLEHFSETNQHTIAALEAASTFAAVVVSLVLALLANRSSRTRARVSVQVQFIFRPTLDGKTKPEYVTATITNIGVMPASIPISFLAWKVPFYSDYLQAVPWDYAQHDRWAPQRVYPTEIKPRASETFFLPDLSGFRTTMAEKLQRIRLLPCRIRFIKAIILTADGRRFRVKLDKSVRRELAKTPRAAKALEHF
jgi:hypothetical protein